MAYKIRDNFPLTISPSIHPNNTSSFLSFPSFLCVADPKRVEADREEIEARADSNSDDCLELY